MASLKTLVFFLNPHAGLGRIDAFRREARASLWGYRLDFRLPSSAAELQSQCAALSPTECVAAVVVGGDGTMSTALPGLLKSGVPLFPFPYGTANDLAVELHCLPNFSLLQYLVDKKKTRSLDVLAVNGIPFLTVGGLGIGSKLLCEFNERRIASRSYSRFAKLWGPKIYTFLTAKTVLMGKEISRTLHLKSDEFRGNMETVVLLACNQPRLGKEIIVAPEAKNSDGLMDMLVLTNTGPHRTLQALTTLRRGEDPADCVRFRTARLEVRDDKGRDLVFFGDGDILCTAKNLVLEVLPERVTVFSGTPETDHLFT